MKTNLSEPWPFKGNLKSKISIGEKYITQKLTIFNDDNEIMPFSMGWHPWFKRTLSSGEIEIKFDSQYKWEYKRSFICNSRNSSLIEVFVY